MTDENTYTSPTGGRRCRRCAADRAGDRRRDAYLERRTRQRPRGYRPRGLAPEQLVAWALEGQPANGCWTWPHGQLNGNGYMALRVDGKSTSAHRLVYEVAVGAIPTGLVVDHLCHDPRFCEGGDTCPHRACIRPDHLAAVSPERNVAKDRVSRRVAVECLNGHAFTPATTYTDARGSRHCKTCANERASVSTRRPLRAKTHCKNGLHEMQENNVVIDSRGHRRCGACRAATLERHGKKLRATPPARCPKDLHDMTEDHVVLTGRGRECRACRDAAAPHACVRGHDFTRENTRIRTRSDGATYRTCRQCAREDARTAYRRKIEASM